jgi:threonine/homoserine efflux transporter RhtA
MAAIGLVEAILLVFSLGMVSLSFGIKGADFRELPRPRMIRPLWNFINFLACLFLGLAIVSPIIPYGLKILFDMALPESYLYIALSLSGVIASVVTYIFRGITRTYAEEFLLKAEV